MYKLLFANQSIDTKKRYNLVRETKMYLFLVENCVHSNYVFRVHKKTLNVTGFTKNYTTKKTVPYAERGYGLDTVKAIWLEKVD
jgi:hypothetical protein